MDVGHMAPPAPRPPGRQHRAPPPRSAPLALCAPRGLPLSPPPPRGSLPPPLHATPTFLPPTARGPLPASPLPDRHVGAPTLGPAPTYAHTGKHHPRKPSQCHLHARLRRLPVGAGSPARHGRSHPTLPAGPPPSACFWAPTRVPQGGKIRAGGRGFLGRGFSAGARGFFRGGAGIFSTGFGDLVGAGGARRETENGDGKKSVKKCAFSSRRRRKKNP